MANNFTSATAMKEYYSSELKEIGLKLARGHAAALIENGGLEVSLAASNEYHYRAFTAHKLPDSVCLGTH